MTTNIVVTTPEMTLREVAELFATHHISGAPVVSGAKVVGVVSAADILELAATSRGVPNGVDERSELLGWNDPALDGDATRDGAAPTAYFTDLWSEASDDVTERVNNPLASDVDILDERSVEDIMSRPLVALAPHDDVCSAADLMRRKSIHRVLVVQNGELVGIVTTLDIVKAVADGKLMTRTYVFDRARSATNRELEA
ncbi:MAG TPA: CBS domain-containing protein [Gemmatimonadaceae bacterium]|jgi:CBS domain-containing protein